MSSRPVLVDEIESARQRELRDYALQALAEYKASEPTANPLSSSLYEKGVEVEGSAHGDLDGPVEPIGTGTSNRERERGDRSSLLEEMDIVEREKTLADIIEGKEAPFAAGKFPDPDTGCKTYGHDGEKCVKSEPTIDRNGNNRIHFNRTRNEYKKKEKKIEVFERHPLPDYANGRYRLFPDNVTGPLPTETGEKIVRKNLDSIGYARTKREKAAPLVFALIVGTVGLSGMFNSGLAMTRFLDVGTADAIVAQKANVYGTTMGTPTRTLTDANGNKVVHYEARVVLAAPSAKTSDSPFIIKVVATDPVSMDRSIEYYEVAPLVENSIGYYPKNTKLSVQIVAAPFRTDGTVFSCPDVQRIVVSDSLIAEDITVASSTLQDPVLARKTLESSMKIYKQAKMDAPDIASKHESALEILDEKISAIEADKLNRIKYESHVAADSNSNSANGTGENENENTIAEQVENAS